MDLGRERQRAAAWSPLGVGDFHVPGRFGILTFEGPPEDMQGNAEPTTIPPGRVPETFRRDPAGEPRLKGSAVEKRQQRHRLESSGGGY